jgi:hypothetical protein
MRFQGEGFTRDLSASGAYIYASSCPPTGSSVLLDVLVPQTHRRASIPAFRTAGVVVRVEHHGASGPTGFAVAVEQGSEHGFELVELGEEDSTTDDTNTNNE